MQHNKKRETNLIDFMKRTCQFMTGTDLFSRSPRTLSAIMVKDFLSRTNNASLIPSVAQEPRWLKLRNWEFPVSASKQTRLFTLRQASKPTGTLIHKDWNITPNSLLKKPSQSSMLKGSITDRFSTKLLLNR